MPASRVSATKNPFEKPKNLYMKLRTVLSLVCFSTLVAFSTTSFAQLFSDDFDADHTANWTVNKSTGANANDAGSFANFFYDYSTVGIPSAPHSTGGTTLGLQLRANVSGGVFSGLSVSPTGQSFLGDYTLRFDMWLNYQGGTSATGIGSGGVNAAGGSGTTQIAGVGIGTAGTSAQWAGGAQDSVHFGATVDGGSSVDYRAYSSAAATGYGDTSGVFAAGTTGSPRNDSNAYYSSLGEKTAPLAQVTLFPEQAGTTRIGAPGFAWREVEVKKTGNTVAWSIDGLPLATVDATGLLSGDNILFNYYDSNAGISTDANAPLLLFGLIDNVVVAAVPEPSMFALATLGGLALLGLRRRK